MLLQVCATKAQPRSVARQPAAYAGGVSGSGVLHPDLGGKCGSSGCRFTLAFPPVQASKRFSLCPFLEEKPSCRPSKPA